MRFKPLAALAAASLVMASSAAVAQSAPTAAAPVADRAGADLDDANQLRSGGTVLIIGAIVLGLVIWGIIELTDDDDPVSP